MENKFYHRRGIIVEGVECAGKTTLIQRLRSEIVPWDCKMLAHKPCQQFDRFMTEYVTSNEVIFNRSHISEIVYSKLWNRGEPFSNEERKVLDEFIGRHYVLIFCEAETSLLIERYETRDYKQKVTANEFNRIKEIFNLECGGLKFIHYDGSKKENLNNIMPIIQAALEEQ